MSKERLKDQINRPNTENRISTKFKDVFRFHSERQYVSAA